MHEAGHSKAVLWDNPEGWGRGGDGRGSSGWGDTCAPVTDSCRCMANTTTILQSNYPPIKINKFFLKIKKKKCVHTTTCTWMFIAILLVTFPKLA